MRAIATFENGELRLQLDTDAAILVSESLMGRAWRIIDTRSETEPEVQSLLALVQTIDNAIPGRFDV